MFEDIFVGMGGKSHPDHLLMKMCLSVNNIFGFDVYYVFIFFVF